MKHEITRLADDLFLRYPYDPPDKLFQLAERYLEFREKYIAGTLTPDPVVDNEFSLPMDPFPEVED